MKLTQYIFICLLVLQVLSCRKKEREGVPAVTTRPVEDVFVLDAKCGGNIEYDGSSEIIEKGLCWSLDPNPTADDFKWVAGNGAKSFTGTVGNLQPATKYFVRAYAINAHGIGYGKQEEFTTLAHPSEPMMYKITIESLSSTAVTLSASFEPVEFLGKIEEQGFCYSETGIPDINSQRVAQSGISQHSFSASISGLRINTHYVVRSYAITRSGTYYGEFPNAFTTYSGVLTDQQGNSYPTVMVGDKEWVAENFRCTKYRDGSEIPLLNENGLWVGSTEGAYCYLNGLVINQQKFGCLYNFAAVGNPKKLAPPGWHVATAQDWSDLLTTVKANQGQWPMANIFHPQGEWKIYPTGTTNATSISFRAGGRRIADGTFDDLRTEINYWSPGEPTAADSLCYVIFISGYKSFGLNKRSGAYVRLVRD